MLGVQNSRTDLYAKTTAVIVLRVKPPHEHHRKGHPARVTPVAA